MIVLPLMLLPRTRLSWGAKLTWSLIPSSREEAGITGLSAWHDKCLPLSSTSGMKVTVETVTFESDEWLSKTSVNFDELLNQEILGLGRDPIVSHLNSILFPAVIEVRGGISLTWRGFTDEEKSTYYYNERPPLHSSHSQLISRNVDVEMSWVKLLLDALQMSSFIKWDRLRDGRRYWLWEIPVDEIK